jgi:ribonuclease HII
MFVASPVMENRLRAVGFDRVAGCDEAGRGALAGPLVAAAVVLPPECPIEGLADSKLLTPERRSHLARQIREVALAVTVVRAGPDTIDRVGLQRTNLALLCRALRELPGGYDYALADGFALPSTMPAPVLGVRKGDQLVACVAAASIIAKVTRDQIMVGAARRFRGYGFQRHKGYGTDEHWAALRKLGPSAYHRYSFTGVVSCGTVGLPLGDADRPGVGKDLPPELSVPAAAVDVAVTPIGQARQEEQ